VIALHPEKAIAVTRQLAKNPAVIAPQDRRYKTCLHTLTKQRLF
jgi:hypothetical protein